MIFGRPADFAIEAMSQPALNIPSAVWGRMRVWCQGVSIGDFTNEYCSLYVAYLGFKACETKLSKLWRYEFSELSDLQILNFLDERLYGCHGDIDIHDGRTVEECRKDWAEYGDFNFLTNWGEQFDQNGKSFILCRPDGNVCIFNRSVPAEYGVVLRAPLLIVRSAMRDFVTWFEGEVQRLSGMADI